MAQYRNRRIVIAVDYGTTATSVAYQVMTGNASDSPVVMTNWPGYSGVGHVARVPSVYAYDEENWNRWGNLRRSTRNFTSDSPNWDRWGFQVTPNDKACAWMKLELNRPDYQFGDSYDDFNRFTGLGIGRVPHGKQAIQVVADFFERLYNHIWTEIGTPILPVQYVITVPAAFTPEGKASIRNAALRTSFGCQATISSDLTEPEAAASYVFSGDYLPGVKASIKDKVLVCDLGGGTTDTAAFEVLDVGNPIQVKQLTAAQGDEMGGTAIDRAFYQMMAERFWERFSNKSSSEIGPGSLFMTEFENVKRCFTGGEDEQTRFYLPLAMGLLPNSEHYENAGIILSMTDLRSIFYSLANRICRFVMEQFELAGNNPYVKFIVIVGGLSRAPWIQAAFNMLFAEFADVRVIFPQQPDTAVVQGAVIHAVQTTGPARVPCPSSYGLRWDDKMYWILHKGTLYLDGHTETATFTKKHVEQDLLQVWMPLYKSEQDGVTGPTVQKDQVALAKDIYVNFNQTDLSLFPHWREPNLNFRNFYELKFHIEVTYKWSEGKIRVRALALKEDVVLFEDDVFI
ncbi:hypothetical protein ASPCADRAFT_8934 [Aspergillus carbonarius ITEM 5010]|uniref:Uncharacterized protein n=1 Tax=Aspergillus carbonarius (strain ITEM 5010) TaxID=602072 RepID=A0A1R3RC52_ASPC5|nr:hypothetical protein ASPCADRAFT_8934 [Aspergillus carbonarius ITEM 5010]